MNDTWRSFWTDFSHEAYDHINLLSGNRAMLARVAELAGTGGYVLDAGCGTGNLTLLLAAANNVFAIDYSPGMVTTARAKTAHLPNVYVEEADVCALPCDDNHFDAVTSVNVFFNLEHPERAASEAARVLKPGGVLVVSTPIRGRVYSDDMIQRVRADAVASSVAEDKLAAVWGFQSRIATEGGLKYTPSIDELEQLLRGAGLEVRVTEDTYYGANVLLQARKQPT